MTATDTARDGVRKARAAARARRAAQTPAPAVAPENLPVDDLADLAMVNAVDLAGLRRTPSLVRTVNHFVDGMAFTELLATAIALAALTPAETAAKGRAALTVRAARLVTATRDGQAAVTRATEQLTRVQLVDVVQDLVMHGAPILTGMPAHEAVDEALIWLRHPPEHWPQHVLDREEARALAGATDRTAHDALIEAAARRRAVLATTRRTA